VERKEDWCRRESGSHSFGDLGWIEI